MRLFFAILGWVLLALLGLLVLALLAPVRAVVEYREGALSVKARVLGIPLRVYPRPGQSAARSLRARKKKTARAKPKPKRKGFSFALEDLQNLLGAAGVLMRRAFRAIHISQVIVILPIHRDDAAQTALACGRAEAWLGGMAALARNFFDVQIVQLRVLPDYTNEIAAGVYGYGKIGVRPIALLAAGFYALGYMMRKAPPEHHSEKAAPRREEPADAQRK